MFYDREKWKENSRAWNVALLKSALLVLGLLIAAFGAIAYFAAHPCQAGLC